MYEALGMCPEGEGGHLIDSAEWIGNRHGKYDNQNCRIVKDNQIGTVVVPSFYELSVH